MDISEGYAIYHGQRFTGWQNGIGRVRKEG